MLDEALFKKVSAHWKGRIYQQWSKERYRLLEFRGVARSFKGLHVVDMGCNAGLHAFDVCDHAKSYLGIELDKEYYRQAQETRKFITHPDCVFVRANAIDYVLRQQPKMDALLLSFIIYHFSNDEVGTLRDRILPTVPFLVVYNRVDRPTLKNSWNFQDPDKTKAFLREAGYKIKLHWGHKERFYRIIARKENV